MAEQIPESHKDLLTGPVYVTLTTILPSGYPQSTIVSCDYDGEHILISATKERPKTKNMMETPRVSLMVVDPQNPYRYLEVRADVEITEEGWEALINKMAKSYAGKDTYYGGVAPAEDRDKEERVLVRLTPVRARAFPPQS